MEIKSLQLKENALGGVDIVYANMQEEIYDIIDNCNSSQEFISYLKKDNYRSFILKSKDISKSNLSNTEIELINKTPFGEVNNLEFAMNCVSREDNYKKQIKVKIRVKNPWYECDIKAQGITEEENSGFEKDVNNQLDNIDELITENISIGANNENNLNIHNEYDLSEDDFKQKLKNQKLITIYDYEVL